MDDITSQINELFDELKSTDIYKNYDLSKKQLESNKEIMGLINEIKRLQKIATNNNDNVIENNIKELYKKLNNYPLYQSYIKYKDELENELILISNTFEMFFKELLKI